MSETSKPRGSFSGRREGPSRAAEGASVPGNEAVQCACPEHCRGRLPRPHAPPSAPANRSPTQKAELPPKNTNQVVCLQNYHQILSVSPKPVRAIRPCSRGCSHTGFPTASQMGQAPSLLRGPVLAAPPAHDAVPPDLCRAVSFSFSSGPTVKVTSTGKPSSLALSHRSASL